MNDAMTSDFYAREARAYTSHSRDLPSSHLTAFAARLSPGGEVLELGCGGGQDSEALIAAGLNVTPTDGTAEMAAVAQERLNRPVGVLRFEDIAAVAAFDGIWANACLLHAPRDRLGSIIERIHIALRPGGIFYASYKTGKPEGRDRFGRYYNQPDAAWLRRTYLPERWSLLDLAESREPGYFGEPSDWLYVTAIKA